MFVRHLSVRDFRSYETAELPLAPGITTLVGLNGQGKTNLVEAIGYLATLGSHRVATDAPLVKFGAPQAVVRGLIVRDGRESLVELEIVPGRANRARLNRSPTTRPRDVLGTLRTVLFAPEDLALVKGDPSERRRFLDDLLVQRQPRWAGVRSDYDKILKQRNALLRSAVPNRRSSPRGVYRSSGFPQASSTGLSTASDRDDEWSDSSQISPALATLEVWNEHLAAVGSQLLYARLRLLRDLQPFVTQAYDAVSDSQSDVGASYRSSLGEDLAETLEAGAVPDAEELRLAILARLSGLATAELARGVTLAGPHRDDLHLQLGELPAKGYASHGESWSFALALRLAAYQLLRRDLGTDPVLVLDDVFAELDSGRRHRLAGLIAGGEQILITAAVPEDVPAVLTGARFMVTRGAVEPATTDARPAPLVPPVSPEENHGDE
jgi:DNA replication and repair protein RecF